MTDNMKEALIWGSGVWAVAMAVTAVTIATAYFTTQRTLAHETTQQVCIQNAGKWNNFSATCALPGAQWPGAQ